MTWLLEEPLYVAAFGGIFLVILVASWLNTGHRALLIGAVFVGLITGGLLILEQAIVTPREEIEQTLHRIAADVARNDVPAVLSHIHSEAVAGRARAQLELPRWNFERVTVKRNLEVELKDTQPATAIAEFNAVVVLNDSTGVMGTRTIPRFVIATLKKENGKWRVFDYEHFEFQRGMQER